MKMRNMKRVFSTALASAMALSLITVPVYADEEEESKPTVITEVPVAKWVEVTEGAAIPKETFTFKMSPATGDDKNGDNVVDDATIQNQKVYVGVTLGDDGTVEYAFDSSDTDDAVDGIVKKSGEVFDLTDVDFGHTGIFRYYVTEELPDVKDREPYITYSEEKYMIDLYVFNGDADAEGNPTYEVKSMDVTKINGETTKSVKPQDIVFTNTINDNLLTISKTVEGEEYTKDELFDFWIEIPEGGETIDLEEGTEIFAKIYDANGLVNDSRSNSNGILPITVKGDKDNVAVETDGTHFQLKSGEELRIYAPITMIYFVKEKDYSGEGYTQTYAYTESGYKSTSTMSQTETSLNAQKAGTPLTVPSTYIKGTINTTTNTVAFTNSRNIEAPDTGINLAILPYALITLCAVCGGILFISRKRRVDR